MRGQSAWSIKGLSPMRMRLKIIRGTNDLCPRHGDCKGRTLAWGPPMADDSASLVSRVALGSLAVGLIVLALKTVAAWLTGSLALTSDALESTVNVVTAILAFGAV